METRASDAEARVKAAEEQAKAAEAQAQAAEAASQAAAAGKKELEDKGGRPSTAPANLNSASAAELKSTIQKQEAELNKQQKLIEDLQKKLAGK